MTVPWHVCSLQQHLFGFFYVHHRSVYSVHLLQPRIFENVRSYHLCRTLHVGLLRTRIFVDDGNPKPFCAMLVDIQYVIFYSLLVSSRLWTCAKARHDGHSICTPLLITSEYSTLDMY